MTKELHLILLRGDPHWISIDFTEEILRRFRSDRLIFHYGIHILLLLNKKKCNLEKVTMNLHVHWHPEQQWVARGQGRPGELLRRPTWRQRRWEPPHTRAVSTTAHLCTSRTYFECLVRSHWQNQQNSVHWKYPDGALETVKKWSVKRWTLRALSGRHLGYVAEEEEPFRQLFTRRARLFWQV